MEPFKELSKKTQSGRLYKGIGGKSLCGGVWVCIFCSSLWNAWPGTLTGLRGSHPEVRTNFSGTGLPCVLTTFGEKTCRSIFRKEGIYSLFLRKCCIFPAHWIHRREEKHPFTAIFRERRMSSLHFTNHWVLTFKHTSMGAHLHSTVIEKQAHITISKNTFALVAICIHTGLEDKNTFLTKKICLTFLDQQINCIMPHCHMIAGIE